MAVSNEVIEKPLSRMALAEGFRALCTDPRFANLPGKIELDTWGGIRMSPANNAHGRLQARLVACLLPMRGEVHVEASIVTTSGLLVADVAWASSDFMVRHGDETPFEAAPKICIEVASPSNSLKELREQVGAYLEAGAAEAWIVYPDSKRIEHFVASGMQNQSGFSVDVAALFR
jgi:Uma2 family endonuclease